LSFPKLAGGHYIIENDSPTENMAIHRNIFSVTIFCCLLNACLCAAQNEAMPLLKAADLRSDAIVLREAYGVLHPGLYRYNTKAQMDAAFAELDRELNHDQTLQDAFLAFSEFAAKVRCGHTQANPFNQSKQTIQILFKSTPRVPFYFVWLDRRMVVTQDFSEPRAFAPGTEIVAIDGVRTQTILARLMTIARADGANDSKRVAQLAVTGDSEYETFDLFYPMFFPLQQARFDFVVRRPGSQKTERVSAKPLSFEERIAPIKQREAARKGGSDILFQAQTLEDRSLYLKMPTWALYDSKWDWKKWLNEKVDAAVDTKAPALILDLRGNEGGEDVGNEILPHLMDTPMPLSPMRRFVRYRKVPDDLVPYLDTWDNSFRDWGASAVALAEPWPTAPPQVSYLKLTRYDDDGTGDVIQPRGKRFRGKVFVLIDATNSSATFQFAQNIQSHHLGTLIGQTTGGSQRGINGGAFFFLRLPKSGIELDLPLIATFPPQPVADAGVTPDLPVVRTASDIAKGTDPELDTARMQTQKY
jgi:hypothetical protein